MATAPADLLALADAAVEWYWRFGTKRTGSRYEISSGTWLDEIYRVRAHARAVCRAETGAKPTMALWGPSQTGKSTLLSGYLDDPADDRGASSALCWSADEPVRFVVGNDKSDGVIVLNPFNFASDASGCVSRFVVRDEVPDPAHPVEVEFATEAQITQALATGYLSECDPKNARGETTVWTEDSYKALLERQKSTGQPNRRTFEALQQLCGTVDLLILSGLPRYADLERSWKKFLRAQTLQTAALLGSVEAVELFGDELFWDNWGSLTQTCRMLVARRRQMTQDWGERPVRCSFRTAAVLLDIDAYKKYSGDGAGTGAPSAVRRKVDGITVARIGDTICLGQGEGSPLVRHASDFGALQALVWELKFPLRRDVLARRSPVLAEFFETADLLDFPGVANHPGNAKLHTDETVRSSPQAALTEVLKRGKTASVVVTSARNLDIDGFSILVRMDRFPGQPRQLVAGMKSWMESYDPKLWPPRGKTLPLNLIITFSGTLVNQVRSAGIREGLQPVFDRLKSLAYLADGKVVTTLATNYPQFDDGHINGTPEQQREALDAIIHDAAFRERFGDGADTFNEMFADGGTDYVFRVLTAQARQSRRREIAAARLDEAAARLRELLVQHTPGEDAQSAERARALDAWIAAIRALAAEPVDNRELIDPVTRLSFHLRSFVNVDPEELEDIPQNATQRRLNVREFVEKQFRNWLAGHAAYAHPERLGLEDGAAARRVLTYLVEATDLGPVLDFFDDTLGHLGSRNEGRHARRFLAVEMNTALLGRREQGGAHRPMSGGKGDVPAVLASLAAFEDHRTAGCEESPHYLAVVAPLLRRLEATKSHRTGDRPPQPGDAELVALLHPAA